MFESVIRRHGLWLLKDRAKRGGEKRLKKKNVPSGDATARCRQFEAGFDIINVNIFDIS